VSQSDEEKAESATGDELEELAVGAVPKLAFDAHRQAIRERALGNTLKQATRMRKRARDRAPNHGLVAVGSVVQVAIDKVDRGKLDATSLVGVVVRAAPVTSGLMIGQWYTVALRECVLDCVYGDWEIACLDYTVEEAGLVTSLANWKTFPRKGPRAAARLESDFGGQGVVRCNCTGVCARRCACSRAGRPCGPACRCDKERCMNTAGRCRRAAPVGAADAESGSGALGPNQFAVEKLLAHRRVSSGSARTRLEYLVRWAGYGSEDDSWEPSSNVEGSLKQDYLANH